VVTLVVLLCAMPAFGVDETARFHAGIRGGVTLGDGIPSNDMPYGGAFGRYRLGDQWLVGVGVDRFEFDFEQPANVVGIDPTAIVDALATEYVVNAWVERELTAGTGLTPFLGAGIGIGFVNVDDAVGTVGGGGAFRLTTDAGTEFIPSALGGIRYGGSAFAELGLHADYRFTTWDVTDEVSGATGSIDDYFTYGAHIAVAWKF